MSVLLHGELTCHHWARKIQRVPTELERALFSSVRATQTACSQGHLAQTELSTVTSCCAVRLSSFSGSDGLVYSRALFVLWVYVTIAAHFVLGEWRLPYSGALLVLWEWRLLCSRALFSESDDCCTAGLSLFSESDDCCTAGLCSLRVTIAVQ